MNDPICSPPGRNPPRDIRLGAWRSFLEAHAAVTPGVDQALMAEAGLPLTWYDVLIQLGDARDQRLRMGQLADAVLLSRSGLTRLIDRIEADGLVARQAIPGDRRSNHVVLTEKGKRRLELALPIATRAINKGFSSLLSEDEAERLIDVLGRVRDRALKTRHPSGSDGGAR